MNMLGAVYFLDKAQQYADKQSTCEKVQVGSVIVPFYSELIYGANHGIDYDCKKEGCHRVKVYGEDSKLHRLPSDCMAIHSEVDAICHAAQSRVCLDGATIYVTRYPCEACARAIVQAGIRKVIYGRSEEISEMTREIFTSAGVEVVHVSQWDYRDNNS